MGHLYVMHIACILQPHRIKHALCSKSLANIIYDMGLLPALFSSFKPLHLCRRLWHDFFCATLLVFLIFTFILHQLFQYNEKEMTKTKWCEQDTWWFSWNRAIVVQVLSLWKCSGRHHLNCHLLPGVFVLCFKAFIVENVIFHSRPWSCWGLSWQWVIQNSPQGRKLNPCANKRKMRRVIICTPTV